MNDKIDILMATYNGEKYISEQISSILNQTYKNFRLIICDDCSTDKTYQILKEYEKQDKRIEVYKNKTNLGVIKNFEFLLSKVKNKYYMFSDQDDVWIDNKIELTYKKIIEEKAELVFTDLEIVDDKLNIISNSFNRYKKLYRKIKKFNDIRQVYLYNVVTGCTIMSTYQYINEFLPLCKNNNILHDHYIPLCIYLLGGKIVYLDIPTIKYRQHGNNEVGVKRFVDKLDSYEKIRSHLIDVKISLFSTYVEMKKYFSNEMMKKNERYLQYFKSLKKIKNIDLKNTRVYFEIYKNETITYKILYYFIFHIPIVGKLGYKIVSFIKNVKK